MKDSKSSKNPLKQKMMLSEVFCFLELFMKPHFVLFQSTKNNGLSPKPFYKNVSNPV